MTRIHTACYGLIASAFVLAGLLVADLGRQGGSQAHADMVIARPTFAMLTAQTRTDEESLFLLDNASGALLVYRLDVSDDQIELANAVDLGRIFGVADGAPEPGGREDGGR